MRGLDPRIHDEARIQNSCDIHDEAQIQKLLRPRIHDEAQTQNACDSDRLRGLMDCRVKPGNDSGEADGAAGPSGAKTALRAFCPAMAAERLVVRPCLPW